MQSTEARDVGRVAGAVLSRATGLVRDVHRQRVLTLSHR